MSIQELNMWLVVISLLTSCGIGLIPLAIYLINKDKMIGLLPALAALPLIISPLWSFYLYLDGVFGMGYGGTFISLFLLLCCGEGLLIAIVFWIVYGIRYALCLE